MPRPLVKRMVLVSLLIAGLPLPLHSAQPKKGGIAGDWRLAIDFGERQMEAILSLSEEPGGRLAGRWISLWGAVEVKDLKHEGDALSFVQVGRLRDSDLTSTFKGRIKDGVLTGTLSSERGEARVEGRRIPAMPRAAGSWVVRPQADGREPGGTLVIKPDGRGRLTGEWQGAPGEHQIRDLVVKGGRLTFTRKSRVGERSWESQFDGTIKANKLTGTFKTDQGERAVEADRVGGRLIGKWDLDIATDTGARKQVLTVNPDLSGLYGPVAIEKVDLKDDRVAFKVGRAFGERTFEMTFEGRLSDGKLAGELTGARGRQKVTGVRRAPAATQVARTSRRPDVIYVPTPQHVVDRMLELAGVKKSDLVYDLGCGDGRIVIAAAKKYGCRGVGYDIDPARVRESLANVRKAGVGDLVRIEQKDIFTLDLSDADVVTLYLLPELNVRLIPQLEKLKPGARIVSHDFDMRGVTPDKVVEVKDEAGNYDRHTIYLWTTPLKKERQ